MGKFTPLLLLSTFQAIYALLLQSLQSLFCSKSEYWEDLTTGFLKVAGK